jgi:type IV pilus assembly protein PilM
MTNMQVNSISGRRKINCRSRYSPIGLDLGSSRIKMIQLRSSGKKLYLHQIASVSTPGGSVKNGLISDPGPLIETLTKLRTEQRWHHRRVSIALSPPVYYLRRVNLPPMSDSETSKAMRWEVEKHFPIEADKAVFDYFPAATNIPDRSSPKDYILAAADGAVADAYTYAVMEAGLFPASLEILPLSLLRSFTFSEAYMGGVKTPCRLVLDIGFLHSSLLIVQGNNYHFSRNIKLGVYNFCRAIQDAGGLEFKKSLKLLYSPGTLVDKGLTREAGLLAVKIAQSTAYALEQAKQHETEPGEILLCGGGALIPGLPAYIKQNLSLRPVLFNPLPENLSIPIEHNRVLKPEGALFAAALGLALRGWLR